MLPLAVAQSLSNLREQEIATCLPGEVGTWNDNRDRPAISQSLVFAYRHDSAPSWFSEQQVLTFLESAIQAWSLCGIASRVTSLLNASNARSDAVTVIWSEEGSRNNFGLANLGNRTLNLGPQAFALLKKVNPNADAGQVLQMVISHEMGHFYGVMAHSRRCVDVTSYYDNGQGQTCTIRGGLLRPPGMEYRSALPTACDIQRCKAANGIR